jgi:hypothetical protein
MAYDYSQYQVTDDNCEEYVFAMLVGEPSIFVTPAHDSNPVYYDERLRLQIERSEQAKSKPRRMGGITVDEIKAQEIEERDLAITLIAKCCAKRWGKPPVDTKGQTPEFSEQEAYDFLSAIPDYMQIPFVNFCANLFNFVKRPPVDPKDAKQLGNG